MASQQKGVSYYSSISNIEKENNKFHYVEDDYTDIPEDYSYPFPLESESEDYDSSSEYSQKQNNTNAAPEVNLKNVLSGIVAIVSGRASTDTSPASISSNNVSFLGSAKNGDTFLHNSVYTPSAPPFDPNAISNYKEVLECEPPEWVPDSCTNVCMQCNLPFTSFTRGRHHCRFCGGIFCRVCSKGRCLLPVKFRERDPQRVCDSCYDRLDPLQPVLINTISNAVQVAKHDVMDWTCTRGWLNLPLLGSSMEHEIYKSANVLRSYCQVARLNPERSIPYTVLKGAKGLAILSVAKGGVVVSYKVGTGLVVARRQDGSWSAPSAIYSFGLGWGPQVGGELMDYIIVLHDYKAVKTFCSRMHFSLGAGCSAAAGPIGRVVEADIRAGDKGSGMCYTYSCTKGAFVGVSLEGNIVATRMDTNLKFYGDPYLTTADILVGTVDKPKAAQTLYASLDQLYSTFSS
jgi:lipid-binding SYLF domain-containing protein